MRNRVMVILFVTMILAAITILVNHPNTQHYKDGFDVMAVISPSITNCEKTAFTAGEDSHPGFPYFAPGCRSEPSAWTGIAFDAPNFFPIRPFQIVLGTRDKPCQYIPGDQCDAFSRGETEWPEFFVIDVLIAMLGDCPLRQCHVLDLGGNMGYVNSYAASLGAKVISVEPQADLAEANRATIQHNCWQHRVTNLNGFITLKRDEHNDGTTMQKAFWRPGYTRGSPGGVPKREVTKLYLGEIIAMLNTTQVDLVKIDVDSIDLDILKFLTDYIQQGKGSIQAFVIESACSGPIFFQLQKLGYHIFQLDHHLRTRFFDARGRDVYKYRGAPIPFVEEMGEEYQCRRGMKQLIKFPEVDTQANAQKQCLKFHLTPVRKAKEFVANRQTNSWLITKESLLSPSTMENWAQRLPPPTRGVYNNEKKGMPGEKINPTPECNIQI